MSQKADRPRPCRERYRKIYRVEVLAEKTQVYRTQTTLEQTGRGGPCLPRVVSQAGDNGSRVAAETAAADLASGAVEASAGVGLEELGRGTEATEGEEAGEPLGEEEGSVWEGVTEVAMGERAGEEEVAEALGDGTSEVPGETLSWCSAIDESRTPRNPGIGVGLVTLDRGTLSDHHMQQQFRQTLLDLISVLSIRGQTRHRGT